MTRPLAALCVTLCLLALTACSRPSTPPNGDAGKHDRPGLNGTGRHRPGMSGLVRYRDGLYLVVHDTKRGDAGPRVSAVAFLPESPAGLRPLPLDWGPADGPPSDLEAICAVPGQSGEFLVAESGHRDGRTGRIIRVRVTGDSLGAIEAEIVDTLDLPPDTHNLEGITFVPRRQGPPTLLTCERDERVVNDGQDEAGAERYALLRWSDVDFERRRLEPVRHTRVRARVWPEGRKLRTCSALHLDGAGTGATLWIAATVEPRKNEAHDSIVYRVALDELTGTNAPIPTMELVRRFPGSKVEGLAAPPTPAAGLAIATDEDASGGEVRLLPDRPTFRR
jgi:hypothetical protein